MQHPHSMTMECSSIHLLAQMTQKTVRPEDFHSCGPAPGEIALNNHGENAFLIKVITGRPTKLHRREISEALCGGRRPVYLYRYQRNT